jgi:hypothetical protein
MFKQLNIKLDHSFNRHSYSQILRRIIPILWKLFFNRSILVCLIILYYTWLFIQPAFSYHGIKNAISLLKTLLLYHLLFWQNWVNYQQYQVCPLSQVTNLFCLLTVAIIFLFSMLVYQVHLDKFYILL